MDGLKGELFLLRLIGKSSVSETEEFSFEPKRRNQKPRLTMIIELNTDHNKEDIKRILSSNRKYQGTVNFSFVNRIANYHINRLENNPDDHMFGYEDNERIIAFLDTFAWPDGENFTLSTSSSDQDYFQKKSENSRWPHSIISLVNYAIFYYQNKGFKTAWTIRPNVDNWIPYAEAEKCILKQFQSEVVDIIPANTTPLDKYKLILSNKLPVEQQVIKIMLP